MSESSSDDNRFIGLTCKQQSMKFDMSMDQFSGRLSFGTLFWVHKTDLHEDS
eukprot:TRINITY_DN1862_c0_g1_i1.p3 TRINITY_DN1862_c0_g1~~TRINITY_DN1862_c0_g1_i1.p3  ORF type:complete len:52 (-),score=1.22 TRINITY_DN1862_c0_g1_i1:154-309(-)